MPPGPIHPAGALGPVVVVLEPDDVVELWSRHLDDLRGTVRGCLEPVDRPRGDVDGLPDAQHREGGVITTTEVQEQGAVDDQDGFVFLVVVLEAEALSRVDVDDLARVVVGVAPEELVSPRLVDAPGHVGEARPVPAAAGPDPCPGSLRRCGGTYHPLPHHGPRDRMQYDIAHIGLSEQGHLRIEWAARRMPVLAAIKERFEREKPLEGYRIGACMHVTSETANLMLTLVAGGADVVLCASNPLSTQDDVAAALVDAGIPVFARRGEDDATFYDHIGAVLDTEPHLIFDDGADMTTVLHRERVDQDVIAGMEETTTGVIRLKAMADDGVLRFPVVAVNDSDTKHLFDNRHGTGQSSLDGILRAANVLFAGRRVVVAGYGDCGWGIATRAKGLGADVIVVEVDPIRAVAAQMEGHRVLSSDEAAEVGDVFITATGNIHVFRGEHFARMKDNAIIANAGHFDVELDLDALSEMAESRRVIRDNLEEFVLPNGHRILVVAEGRLVNLGAAEGHPADVMDMSFSDQAIAAEWIIQNAGTLEPKVYRLPEDLDREVARLKLEAMGGTLEQLTDEQEAYLSSWEHGT